MVPETCWASNKICNKNSSVASSWHFISTYWGNKCLLCVTNWVFKWNGLYFVLKWLRAITYSRITKWLKCSFEYRIPAKPIGRFLQWTPVWRNIRNPCVLRESVLLLRICGTQDELISSVVHAPISRFTLGCISVREIRSLYHIIEATSPLAVYIQPDLFMLLVGEVLNNEFIITSTYMSYCLY